MKPPDTFYIMQRMRWLKKIFFIFLCLLLLSGLGIFYLNTIFLPISAKDILASKATSWLKRNVSIGEINFYLQKGFVLKNIRIEQQPPASVPFISIDEVRFNIVLPNFFRAREIFIPSITLDKPVVHLKRIKDSQWNFSDLLTQSPTQREQKPSTKSTSVKFSLGAIKMFKGQIHISDPATSETISALDASLQLSLPDAIRFESDFVIDADRCTFSTKGKFSLASQELNATIKTRNFNPPRLIHLTGVPLYVIFDRWLIDEADLAVQFKNKEWTLKGMIIGPVDITTKTDIAVRTTGVIRSKNFTYHKRGRDFDLAGNFLATDTSVAVGADKMFSGNFSGTAISFQKSGDHFTMTGDLAVQKAKMLWAQETLTGDIETKKIFFDKLDDKLVLVGESKIINSTFKDPVWDMDINQAAANWKFDRHKNGFLLDIPDLRAKNLSGLFLTTQVDGSATAQNIKIDSTDEILNAQGHFATENLKLLWPNKISFAGNPQCDLTLSRNPAVDDNKMIPSGVIHFSDDTFQGIPKITQVKNLTGQLVFRQDEASSKNLTLTLGQTALSLAGTIKHFSAPDIKTKVLGKDFDISVDFKTASQRQNIRLEGLVYDGKLSVDANVALQEKNVPGEITASLTGLNVQRLKNTFGHLKDKDLSGILSVNVNLKGPLEDYKALKGDGAITIKEGKLLELEMLKGIWKVLFNNLLVEDYRKIAFTHGKATFKVTDGSIKTEDLLLESEPADISARGSLSLNGQLNFDVVAKVRQAPIVTASALQAVPTTIISQVVKNVVGIKLTGSITTPQVRYKILPLKVLEKTTGSIFEGIQGMLEDIWDN